MESNELEKMKFKRYAQYKDTGVEWLGEIPEHWNTLRSKYISKIIMGQSPSSEDYNSDPEGIAFLQGNAEFGVRYPEPRLYCRTSSKISPPGALLLSVRAPVGALNISDHAYGIGRGLCSIKPNGSKLLLNFAWYMISVVKEELFSIANGSTYEAVTVDEVRDMVTIVPPIAEQKILAPFLDRETAKIDALIEKKERLIELLKEKRNALIAHAVTKGLPAAAAAQAGLDPNVPMKDSGVEWIGEIPAHWEVKRLKNICHINPETLKETTASDFEMHYIDISNVQDVTGIFQPQEMIFEEAPSRARRVVRPGDTIISTVRTYLKAVAFFEDAPDNLIVSTGFAVLRPYSSILPKYLYVLVRCQQFIESVVANSVGVAYPAINPSELSALPIWLPLASGQQEAIINFLDRETTKIDNLCVKIREGINYLQEYRTALISAAVTGKIDVREEAA